MSHCNISKLHDISTKCKETKFYILKFDIKEKKWKSVIALIPNDSIFTCVRENECVFLLK